MHLSRLYCYLPLALILGIPKMIYGQSCGLTDVIAQQLADLPKLTQGTQAWADYDRDGRADLLISSKTPQGSYLTRLYHNIGG